MKGELSSDLRGPVAVGVLEAFSDAPMGDALSARAGTSWYKHLPVEVVGEAEARGHGSVGPLDDLSRLDQQPEPGDDRQPFLDLALGQLERGCHRRRRELGARDARRLEQVAVLRSERGEPSLDERAKRSRDARGERLERNGEAHTAVHRDRALRQPRLDEAGHEQGIAAGALREQAREPVGQLVRPQASRENVLRGVDGERRQRQLMAEPGEGEPIDERRNGMASRAGLLGTVRAQDEEAGCLGAPRDHRQQVDRRVIRRVEVLEDDDERVA